MPRNRARTRTDREMRVSIVNTEDRGGAANAAIRLHQGLLALNVDSKLIVYRGREAADNKIVRAQKPIATTLAQSAMRLFLSHHRGLDKSPRSKPVSTCELFSDCRSANGVALKLHPAEIDVLNLHWVARFVDLPSLLPRFAGKVPIVWTLHDMQPLTGGCHYTAGCEAFRSGCQNCPQLIQPGARDASAEIFQARLAALSHLGDRDLHIVAPSKWLLNEAARSAALSRFSGTCIPYGLDTDAFRPIPKDLARQKLGLPRHKRLLLFVSACVQNHRKGLDLLIGAVAQARQRYPDLQVVAVGAKGKSGDDPFAGLDMITLGTLTDECRLAEAYSAADLFVIPSRQDNLPNTMLESIACGTPVVGFDIGGIPDAVRPGQTGWLAKQLSQESLAAAISEALLAMEDRGLVARYQANCRQIAETEFALVRQAEDYCKLFRGLVEHQRKSVAA